VILRCGQAASRVVRLDHRLCALPAAATPAYEENRLKTAGKRRDKSYRS
jgi:hypothetical protein